METGTHDKWASKRDLLMRTVLTDIATKRTEQTQPVKNIYRGLEFPWYGIWNCELARICEQDPSLAPCPQYWVSRTVRDQDDVKKRKTVVPDFVLLRCVSDNGRPQTDRGTCKVVALMEIKCTPANDTIGDGVTLGILEATADLDEQITRLFKSPEGYKAVIGIAVAGNWWTWKATTSEEFGVGSQPSEDEDPTYRPPQGTSRGPQIEPDCYRLGTEESNRQMRKMLNAIANLPHL